MAWNGPRPRPRQTVHPFVGTQGAPGACAVLALVCHAAGLAGQAQPGLPPAWDVAITVDDVPLGGGGGCTPEEIGSVTDALLRALADAEATATAFVIPGTSCQGPGPTSSGAVAERWRAAGHTIGNHSWSHLDFNRTEPERYLADVQRAHAALELLLQESGQAERWYRPPLLHTGETPAERDALGEWLRSNGYRMGVVTIDNQEWVFAAAYDRARAVGDDSLSSRIVGAYHHHLVESVAYYRRMASAVFGREIPQVLLLHANRLNADHLPDVLAMLRGTGARFVSLAQAASDEAYLEPDRYAGARGLSWLQRWAVTRGVEIPPEPRQPDWVEATASGTPVPARAQGTEGADSIDARTAAALDAANSAFSAAWVRGDSAALVQAYTRTGIVHPPAGGVLVGSARLGRYWGPSPGDRVGHRIEPSLRRPLGAGHVLEVGRWHSRRRDADGVVGPWLWGCYTVVWELGVDERWRMLFDTWSEPHEEEWACRPRS